MGLVVSGVWLHIISPDQNALLIVLCGLVTQGSGIWRVRYAINWRAVAPFIIGGAAGVPAGTALLTTVDQGTLRVTMGILLVVYSLYGLIRPAFKPVEGGIPAELGVGVANGLIGGLTGLGGIAVTIWCQLRGGPKDAQRAIFQPVMFSTFLMSAISFAVAGSFTLEAMKLYALALPALVAGIWCGLKLYGKLDDAAFRRMILILLLASGVSLAVPAMLRWTSLLSRNPSAIVSRAGPATVAPSGSRGPSAVSFVERRRLMSSASYFVAPQQLWSRMGTADAPVILDVCRRAIYDAADDNGAIPFDVEGAESSHEPAKAA